ncbi:nucleoside 2-deoxyribosyltransferase domain-containing protein [Chryseobacterium phocaeense]|uniref:nucleoside 2-deoxyribosyltransferase domain-containing protein n=1 Tax=Chryseobacterium phocaeense TaxID=1816690 RepID=UPI0009BC6C78|nr:nucleoside 2-deoxyribosyltransferase domain-containing protein [Chryseobacterium phocaeense]
MKSVILSLAFNILSLSISAQKVTVVKSPAALPAEDKRLKIFLGGSIDMGNAEDWQAKVTGALSEKDIILFNPRRDDWNKDWKPVSTEPNFRKQLEWELEALEKSDIIIMYFTPKSQSPISLLELGLYARTNKLMVVCPEGYWRKGNVDIVCEKYQIKRYESIDMLINALKKKAE